MRRRREEREGGERVRGRSEREKKNRRKRRGKHTSFAVIMAAVGSELSFTEDKGQMIYGGGQGATTSIIQP